jgi:hypothetical protein
MDNSMCQNGSKITLKIKKNHISRMLHPPYSLDINPSDFWLFGVLKQILRHRDFSWSDEIEDAIAQVGMTSLLTTSKVCSGTGSGVLPGSLRVTESILANEARFASSSRLHVEIGIGLVISWHPVYREIPVFVWRAFN